MKIYGKAKFKSEHLNLMRSLRFKEKCLTGKMLQGGAGGPTSDLLGGKRRRFGDRGGEWNCSFSFHTWLAINEYKKINLYLVVVVGHLGHIYMNDGFLTIAGKKDPEASAGPFRYSVR